MKEQCRSCRAEIYWAKTENGKLMPIDAEPSEGGNCVLYAPLLKDGLTREIRVYVLRSRELEDWMGVAKTLTGDLVNSDDEDMMRGTRIVDCLRRSQQRTSHFATCPNANKHRRKA